MRGYALFRGKAAASTRLSKVIVAIVEMAGIIPQKIFCAGFLVVPRPAPGKADPTQSTTSPGSP